ncbi:MAG: hypothetical protein L6R48_26300, partial [Planctomycetes bacterium]|nr:hypothetical protein [Planctomycetota bacterium]
PVCAGLWPGELRRRADGPAWLVAGGADATGADGQLATVRRGDGLAVFCQLDPAALDAGTVSWNRLTAWRQGRAIAQLAANLGAELACDGRLLAPIPPPDRIRLDGTWKAALTLPLPPSAADQPKPKDLGPTAAALALVRPDADESGLAAVPAGKEWESYGGAWTTTDGEAVFRRTIDIPA